MNNRHHKKSAFARSSVLVFAVFFILFASCPVRKYIRFQLYKHHPVTERAAGKDRVYIQDAKDCCIADKKENSQKVNFSTAQIADNNLVAFFFSAASLLAIPYLFERRKQLTLYQKPREGIVPLFPLYLQVRHIQV